ncbi:hypothetical protein [Pelomicrobium methylotrophicum]|uniref:Glycosyl transferase family 28 C-terminal domain-containing protein n=1 Tax=Pelomicrobium methylotrophicum TaxID=2602750 RepID=A0A5C7F078_9PROT|nr:hypothetical protein [Pelomicrobium methylotrophicum]TXF12841.1 hypothetical protein FR698_04170 [Pelomicrobium methylotrophicum]
MHLLVDISPHGYGHIAQTAPVVNALRERLPRLRVTVCSAAPRAVLASHFRGRFEMAEKPQEPGLLMEDAMTVLPRPSFDAYAALHAHWDEQVERQARKLAALRPDLVLSGAGYLALAAARRAGLRAVGIGSFHWAAMFQHYCGAFEGAGEIVAQMLAAYRGATRFIALTPGMPMPEIECIRVGPVARLGRNRALELRARLGLEDQTRLALVALGGIPMRLSSERWPRLAHLHWLVPRDWTTGGREDMAAFDALGMPFDDLLASVDVVLTKPGYGTFVEAACSGAAVVTLARPDWPESPYLLEWLQSSTRCAIIARERLDAEIGPAVEQLLAQPRPQAPDPTGAREAAKVLEALLNGVP